MADVDRSKQFLKVTDSKGVVKFVGKVGTGTAAITGLKPGTVVKTGDYKGGFDADDQTALSEAASDLVDVPGFTVLPSTVPGAPTIKLTAGDGKIDYVVTPATSASADQVTGYKVQLKKSTDDWDKATTKTDITGTFDKLTNGTEYTVGVVATNAKGDSDINASGASAHATPAAAQA